METGYEVVYLRGMVMGLVQKFYDWIEADVRAEVDCYLDELTQGDSAFEISRAFGGSSAIITIYRGDDKTVYRGASRHAVFSIKKIMDSKVFGMNQVEIQND